MDEYWNSICGRIDKGMELVIGGAAQNKLEYVTNLYDDVVIIDNLQDIIRECMDEKMIYDMIDKNLDCIVICDEVGCGLVPIDKTEREYRDLVGHICCNLAKRATKVHRVICGIGTVIKNA